MFKTTASALRRIAGPQMTRQFNGRSTEYAVGSCGLPTFEFKKPKAEELPNAPGIAGRFKLPEHLIRPPCIPGSKPGKEQTCVQENVGVYCIPNRPRYKYPPFVERMGVIPGDGKVCWWTRTPPCVFSNRDPIFYEKPDVEMYA